MGMDPSGSFCDVDDDDFDVDGQMGIGLTEG